MAVRFYLRDLVVSILAVCGLLGTYCLTPEGCYTVTLLLPPAAVSWHLVKNDWLSCWLAGATGALAMYLFVTLDLFVKLAAASPAGLGLFPELLFVAGPWGFLASRQNSVGNCS